MNQFLVYGISALLSVGLSIYLFNHYHLTASQRRLFILLVLFWSANIIIRAYRKSYALNPSHLGGLALGVSAASVIAAGYGLISIPARFLTFYLSDVFHSRKLLLALGLLSVMVTGVWVLVDPNESSLLASSLALGLSASMLSLFNVIFAQSFDPSMAMVSVSILSIAPLLSEFLMSSFQYAFTQSGQENYPALWGLSVVFAVVAFIFLVFVKDNKKPERVMTRQSFRQLMGHKEIYLWGGIGVLISLIRFASSGSNLITYFQSELIQMPAFWVAYSDFLYSIAQLFGGLLAGLYFCRKWGLKKTLLLGIMATACFNGALYWSQSPVFLFVITAVGGFGYGLVYNSLIGLALSFVDENLQEMSMAIYQTFFALGIFYGDYIYKHMVDWFSPETIYANVFLTMLMLSLGLGLIIHLFVTDKKGDHV